MTQLNDRVSLSEYAKIHGVRRQSIHFLKKRFKTLTRLESDNYVYKVDKTEPYPDPFKPGRKRKKIDD